jgi:flagellar biosynthesis protein FlhF
MKVKRYIGNDLSEAMIRVKNELGRDAVILHTRKIKKKGISGWFGGKLVEVVAAIDEPDSFTPSVNRSQEKEVHDALEAIRQISEQNQPKIEPVVEKEPERKDPLSGEVDELKKMVFKIMEKLDSKNSESIHSVEVQAPIQQVAVNTPQPTQAISVEPSAELKALLRDKELVEQTIESIFNALDTGHELSSMEAIEPIVRDMLGEPYTIEPKSDRQSVYLFVGPTGVGKTTTLAKLAARLSLVENRSVGLITADTFRIAAVEQLKTYSEILGIPLTVIYEAEEIREALKKYKDKDFVLVDTAGRSHKSDELKSDLDNLLKHLKNPEIFLVISLTTGYKDIVSILNSYEFLKDYKLLFTKLDEASSLGNILNVRAHTGKSLSYFAIGQSVPDDIEIANVDRVVNFIGGD